MVKSTFSQVAVTNDVSNSHRCESIFREQVGSALANSLLCGQCFSSTPIYLCFLLYELEFRHLFSSPGARNFTVIEALSIVLLDFLL